MNEVHSMTLCGDMAIQNFPRWWPAAILDLI